VVDPEPDAVVVLDVVVAGLVDVVLEVFAVVVLDLVLVEEVLVVVEDLAVVVGADESGRHWE
jgi:hypothetical protein